MLIANIGIGYDMHAKSAATMKVHGTDTPGYGSWAACPRQHCVGAAACRVYRATFF
ncbi:hypothetical protein [Pinibacter soli]|uniref:hypothetical protein n=1 Tax=Pinibacter soli TaxID=3044211 RepID=UPI00249CDC09|nr:hypothetical protein [Pinibacter soli]